MTMIDEVDPAILRRLIETQAQRYGTSMTALTVMAPQTDPYRMDTAANHTAGAWLNDAWNKSGAPRGLHLRGLHYAFVSTEPKIAKPDGTLYLNTDENWTWLQAISNVARWLGYINFDDIVDERNDAPVIKTVEDHEADVQVASSVDLIDVPDFDDMLPRVMISNFECRQAYRLVLIGEKKSLSNVLLPIAGRYKAEMILPTGQASTTLIYGMVERAAADGRPCRVFYLSDFDPAGWHMPIEVSRKVQALVDSRFLGLDIQVHRCALTREQVRELDLPSTPLKETERRADKWREKWGVDQTEIDALATLRADALTAIVEQALAPYVDPDHEKKTSSALIAYRFHCEDLIEAALHQRQEEVDEARRLFEVAAAAVTLAYQYAQPLLENVCDEVDALLPELVAPEPEPEGDVADPLFDSAAGWVASTRKLIGEKT